MSRTLEDILFADLGRKAQALTRAASFAIAAALFALAAVTALRFHELMENPDR